jgi:hypothetical protein
MAAVTERTTQWIVTCAQVAKATPQDHEDCQRLALAYFEHRALIRDHVIEV